VSNTVSSESVTCPSCEYRYPRSQAICVMCGTAALAVEPRRPLSSVPDEFSGANPGLLRSDCQQRSARPRLTGIIPVVVISIALMVVTLFFYRKGNLPKESGLATELTATSGQPKLENASQRRKTDRGVQQVVAAKAAPLQTIEAGKEDDPVKLWKAVRRGSVRAEVA
jgi:hypothetical protein